MTHTFVVETDDRPDVLSRVTSLFRRRSFELQSLAVGRTETPGVLRMTLSVDADAGLAERIVTHLYKLAQVIRVEDITGRPSIVRDLVLVRVAADRHARFQVMQLADVFRARIVDVAPESLVIEIAGTEEEIDGLLEVLQPYTILEMTRSGRVGMARASVRTERVAQPVAIAVAVRGDSSGISCSV